MKNNELLSSIENKDLKRAKELIKNGEDVNAKGLQNRNAMDWLILSCWDR